MNYILCGELEPMIRKRLNKILKENLGEPDDFNVVKIDFEESTIDEISYEAESLPLGYDKKAVVVDNASFLTKSVTKEDEERILKILESSTDEFVLIFILKNSDVNKKGKIYSYFETNGAIFEFSKIKPNEWPIYIKKYFKGKEVEITDDAVEELSKRIDGDLVRFLNEAEKLILYKNNKINLDDVLLMVSKPLEDDAFQMSNALFRGDNGLAISIYRDLKLLGQKFEDNLIPMLANQFRFISQVRFLSSNGLDSNDIAAQLGANPFRVKMALQDSKKITRKQIAACLDKLYNLDLQIKSGQIDRSYGLELFLINFPN